MIIGNSSQDDIPLTFTQQWWEYTKQGYKWLILPTLLFFFFAGDGWDALRVAQAYKESTGVVTHYTCAKIGVVEYTYATDDGVKQGSTPNIGCKRYNPGETLRVFYSTRHPQLSVVNTPPGKLWMKELAKILIAILVLVPFSALIKLSSDHFRGD